MNQTLSTASLALTQRSRPWDDTELERLKAYADKPATRTALLLEFPDRTIGAVRVQLGKLRRELGIPKQTNLVDNLAPATIEPTMLDPEDEGLPSNWHERWRSQAEISNQRFLNALVGLAA